MKICVLIFNDGRNDYLEQTLKSFSENVNVGKAYKILIDDMPRNRDVERIEKLVSKYKIDKVVYNDVNLGVFGSVQKAWTLIPKNCTHVWHQENDFLFNEKVDAVKLASVLDSTRHVFQLALLRQPWFEFEKKAGGIYKAYKFRDGVIGDFRAVLHRNYFTHNPCIYKKEYAIQVHNYNEYKYMETLLKVKPNGYCGYVGGTEDAPKVTHIGEIKSVR